MSDQVLRLRGVGVRRGKSMLLRDIDWTVHSDESWVVIGPNGAGKTTLLQVAAASCPPPRARRRYSARTGPRPTSSTCGPGSGWPARRWPTGCHRPRRSSIWC